jgi:hypothetical protein
MGFRKIIFLYVVVCLTGCTSFFPVKPDAYGTFRLGDLVEIETVQGDMYRFDVDVVTDEGIGGNGHFIAYREIKKVLRLESDPDETTSLVVIMALYFALGIYFLDQIFDDL